MSVVRTRTRPLERDQPFDEIEARLPEIETAVDMGARNVQKRRGADSLGEGDEDLHRPGGRAAAVAGDERTVGGG